MRRVRLACSTGGLGWVVMDFGLVWVGMEFGLVCIVLGWDASGWGGFWVGVNSKWKDFVKIFSSAGGEGRKQSGVSSKRILRYHWILTTGRNIQQFWQGCFLC